MDAGRAREIEANQARHLERERGDSGARHREGRRCLRQIDGSDPIRSGRGTAAPASQRAHAQDHK